MSGLDVNAFAGDQDQIYISGLPTNVTEVRGPTAGA